MPSTDQPSLERIARPSQGIGTLSVFLGSCFAAAMMDRVVSAM
jgi:hypothetical protein